MERIYLILMQIRSKDTIEECGLFFSIESTKEEVTWAIRFYVILTECFYEWTKIKKREKYLQLLEQIPRLSKEVYFYQNAEKGNINHEKLSERVSNISPSSDNERIRSSNQKEVLNDHNSITRTSLKKHSVYNQLNNCDPRLIESFETLELYKTNYLNCLFNNNLSFKQLILLHKEYETYYKLISQDIQTFLDKNEDSSNPIVQKIIKDLKFSNILAAYLSKITDEFTTDKGVQRVRTNILAFFQAAYREYPTEYQKMVDTQEKTRILEDERGKKNNEEVFVLKNEGIFDKRKLDKLFAPQSLQILNFPESPRGSRLVPRNQNTSPNNIEGHNISRQGKIVASEDILKSENLSLRKQKNKLENEIKLLDDIDKNQVGAKRRSERYFNAPDSKMSHAPIFDIYKKHLKCDFLYDRYDLLRTKQNQKIYQDYSKVSAADPIKGYSRALQGGLEGSKGSFTDKNWPNYKSSLLKLKYNIF
jgi:hypothetical protein